MKVAILSRPGGCFPNVISIGLGGMLQELDAAYKIFYNGIPSLMRLLPMSEQPKRWSNNLHYRIYNKLKYAGEDRRLLQELSGYDLVVVSECLPNALWKNYLSIEVLRERLQKPVYSYNDGPISSAPIHKKMLLDGEDYDERRYDGSFFLTDIIEEKVALTDPKRQVIGLNLKSQGLQLTEKESFTAIVDFAQPGYEKYREQQISVLKSLNINTIVLNQRYEPEAIRDLYRKAAVFFMAFPETFGLPLAECLSTGCCVFTPNSAWPMAWRLDKDPMPWGPGTLPDCFRVYADAAQLSDQLRALQASYDGKRSPDYFFNVFCDNYKHYYEGDRDKLAGMLSKLS